MRHFGVSCSDGTDETPTAVAHESRAVVASEAVESTAIRILVRGHDEGLLSRDFSVKTPFAIADFNYAAVLANRTTAQGVC